MERRTKNDFLTKFRDMFTNLKCKIDQSSEPAVQYLSELISIYRKAGESMKVKVFNKKGDNYSQPEWWDNKCQLLKSNKHSLLRKFRFTNRNIDLITYKKVKNRFKNVCRSKRLKLEKTKRKELLDASKNPKECWKVLKQNCNKKSDLSKYVRSSDWVGYFKGLFTSNIESHSDNVLQNIVQNHDSNVLDAPITEQEIILSIKNIHVNRSPGPDGICIEMLKATMPEILPYLKCLFNDIFNIGICPPDWCKSILCPLHKNGSKTSPTNYRGVSLIDSICKIFNGVLTKRLQKWSEENEVLDESQAGFRKNYSTMDNIFPLYAIAQKYLNKERGRFIVFLLIFVGHSIV